MKPYRKGLRLGTQYTLMAYIQNLWNKQPKPKRPIRKGFFSVGNVEYKASEKQEV
jgi:hypothetical protein